MLLLASPPDHSLFSQKTMQIITVYIYIYISSLSDTQIRFTKTQINHGISEWD